MTRGVKADKGELLRLRRPNVYIYDWACARGERIHETETETWIDRVGDCASDEARCGKTPDGAIPEAVAEETPSARLNTVDGGALELTVGCTACLLDVEIVRWRDGSGTRADVVVAATDIVNDIVDTARIELPRSLVGRSHALELRATLVREDGASTHELQRVVFVKMEQGVDGLVTTPVVWADYLVANNLAQIEVNASGERTLDLTGGKQ